MRGYTGQAVSRTRSWIALGLVAALVLPLFALCPCGREWSAEAPATAAGMAADHSCCASREGLSAAAAACCPQLEGPGRLTADGAARGPHGTQLGPAVLVAAARPMAPRSAAWTPGFARPRTSPPGTTQPSVLRV